MKRRRLEQPAPFSTATTIVHTGEHCPDSGWWYPAGPEVAQVRTADTSGTRFIAEGSVMPALAGKPVRWLRGEGRSIVRMFEELAR